jgi:hypothetical protein
MLDFKGANLKCLYLGEVAKYLSIYYIYQIPVLAD